MISAVEALERLQAGNQRFLSGKTKPRNRAFDSRNPDLADGQAPFAVILGCSDSRVPAEIVFDQDVGDLFVIRVAGNVLSPSVVGSIEFATQQFGCPLLLVLGHSRCGAVQATVDRLDCPTEIESPNLDAILDRIRPVVEALRRANPSSDRNAMVEHAVRANVRTSVDDLRAMSAILDRRVQEDKLLIAGAEYSLETGVVDFFYGVADSL